MGCAEVMVVDSSVIVATILAEPDESYWSEKLASARELFIAAPSIIEIMAVIVPKMTLDANKILGAVLSYNNIRVVAFDEEALEHALDALLRYGRGRHPAKLNFGDCISYGLAKALGAPLLFKGDDFALTDVKRA
jgi:ribonuclease VapC